VSTGNKVCDRAIVFDTVRAVGLDGRFRLLGVVQVRPANVGAHPDLPLGVQLGDRQLHAGIGTSSTVLMMSAFAGTGTVDRRLVPPSATGNFC
jgi:hypothetical protein